MVRFLSNLKEGVPSHRLYGICCSGGTVYRGGCIYDGKILWSISFDNIAIFSKFMWATCFRFFPITRNDKWLLTPSSGDPSYNEKKLRFDLIYKWDKKRGEQMREDVEEIAKGMEEFAEWLNKGGLENESANS